MTKKTDSDYTQKYKAKRQSKEVRFDLYLDVEIEKQIYEKIKAEPRGNAKAVILELLRKHYEI